MTELIFHPEAEEEFLQAAAYYERQSLGLGKEFSSEVQRTLSRVLQYPDGGHSVRGGRRSWRVSRFPYAVIYRVYPDMVRVLAVAHLSRKPGYWRHRL
jgi:plasmid stabilization system protein ParE